MSVSKRNQLLLVVAAGVLALAVAALAMGMMLRSWWPRPAAPNIVVVVASSPGYAAQELEVSVARPLEAQLAGVPSLRSLRTVSSEGVVTADCTFDALVDETRAAEDVREHVRTEGLPRDVQVAVVRQPAAAGELMHYEVTHDKLALVEIRRMHDQEIRGTLEQLPGVERIDECGVGEPEVRVSLDPMRLRGFGLAPTKVREELQRFLASQGSEDHESAGLRNLVLGDGQGTPVRLSDVAVIRIGTAPHACSCVVQGKAGLCVSVRGREAGAGPGGTAEAVQEQVRQWASQAGTGVELHATTDAHASTELELWTAGEIREDAEPETARTVADAVKSVAGGLEVRVQVGAPEGAWPGALTPNGTVEIRGSAAASAMGMQASAAAAIEKAAPWVRVSPAGKPSAAVTEAVIRGPETVQLARIARDVRDRVAGASDVRQAIVLGMGQRAGLEVRLERERAARLGVRMDEAAWIASLAFGGQVLHTSLLPQRAPLVVRLELANVGKDPAQLALLSVPTASGGSVPLSDVAEIRMQSRPDPILREDRQRAALVRVWGPAEPRRGWRQELVQAVTQVQLPVGYSIAWRDLPGD